MTLIGCGADDGVGTGAHASLTAIQGGAKVAIITRGTVSGRRLDTETARGIARALTALIGHGADDGTAADAEARLARIVLGAEVAVVTRCAVGGQRVDAQAGGRVTGAGGMALIGCGADDEIAPGADAGLTSVALCA